MYTHTLIHTYITKEYTLKTRDRFRLGRVELGGAEEAVLQRRGRVLVHDPILCMHVYIYIYIYIHICGDIHIYIYIHMYMYIYIYVYM